MICAELVTQPGYCAELDTTPPGSNTGSCVELDITPGSAAIARALVKYKLIPSVKFVVVAVPKKLAECTFSTFNLVFTRASV